MKRKITVTTGTRADYGLLRPILGLVSRSKKLELFLIVTGMHLSKKYGMTINEIKKDGFKIYKTINMIPKNDSPYSTSKILGEEIIAFSRIFHELKPDINLILGDRNEMLASAIAAYQMNIPNAHIHGGDVSGGIDEYNRHAITKISNIHFAATKKSKQRIFLLGENPKYVFQTGSPSIDEIKNMRITEKNELEKKYDINFTGKEILLLQHPVSTSPHVSGKQFLATLRAIKKLKNATIAIAPNSDPGNRIIFKYLNLFQKKYYFIRMFRSIPRNDYLGFIKNCAVLVGNSSSGMIEASYFNIPVINIGNRQDGRERGKNVIDVLNVQEELIYRAILKALRGSRKKSINTSIYGNGKASEKIVRVLEKIKIDKELIQKKFWY